MAETSRSEPLKSSARKLDKKSGNGADIPFSRNYAEAQARGLASLAQVNTILVDTAKAIWENEMELFRLETEQARGALSPSLSCDNPMTAFSGMCAHWHETTEKSIQHIRAIQDRMRDCEWKILELFAENLNQHRAG